MGNNVLKKSNKAYTVFLWVFAAAITLFYAVVFTYIDIQSNTVWSLNLLDLTFELRIRDFFAYAIENVHGAPHGVMGGNILSLIPCAIWNLPIWIAQRFFGIEVMENSYSMLWAKLYLVFCLAVCLQLAYKIMCELEIEEKYRQFGLIMGATSIVTTMGVGMAGGFDICSIAVFTGAVLALIKNRKALFLILAGIAVAFKPFCLIAVIAIVLYKQKNILKIFLDGIIIVLPTVLINLPFVTAPGYKENVTGLNTSTLTQLLDPELTVGTTRLSLFLLCLILLYIYCYFIKEDKDKVTCNYYIVYIITASYAAMQAWTHTGFYRSIMFLPFLYILIAKKNQYFKLNVILEMFALGANTLFITSTSRYPYSALYITQSILPVFQKGHEGILCSSPYFFWTSPDYSFYAEAMLPALNTIFIAGLGAMLLLLHPKFNKAPMHDMENCEKWIFILRLFVPIVFIAGSIFLYFFR